MQDIPTHFATLVEYLRGFDASARKAMAKLYAAPDADADSLAGHLVADPDGFRRVVDAELTREDDWLVLRQLVLDHDIVVDADWVPRRSRKALTKLGLMLPKPSGRGARHEVDQTWLPAALAVMLADRIEGTRPSAPMLLAGLSDEAVEALCVTHDVGVDGSRIARILRLADRYADAGMLEDIIEQLPDVAWVAWSLMVIELGGMCYWREIFGHDPAEEAETKVVPLMRHRDREEEREVSDLLVDLGLIFRVDDTPNPYAMVAVAEELWLPLWQFGSDWLLDWVAVTWDTLAEEASRRQAPGTPVDLQALLKWLWCETDRTPLRARRERFDADTTSYLEGKLAEGLVVDLPDMAELAFESGFLWTEGDGRIGLADDAADWLNRTPADFTGGVLSLWAAGVVGTRCDEALGRAVGLDESWRAQMLPLLEEYGEVAPAWLRDTKGVAHEETGAGCLRELEPIDPDMLFYEFGLVSVFVSAAKVHWLDLLGLLEPGQWHSMGALTELMQSCAAFALFNETGHVLEHPHFSYYLPVQRASLIGPDGSPVHVEGFGDWVRQILDGLLVPLGVARVGEDGRVLIDSERIRFDAPPGWGDEPRLRLVREVLGDPDFTLAAAGTTSGFKPVLEVARNGDASVSLGLSLERLRAEVGDRAIRQFDGKRLHLQEQADG